MATYYVSSRYGNDNADGLSTGAAWRSISKVNSTHFQPGDQILFERDSWFTQRLEPRSSGTSDRPITFGAYGSGNDPTFDGATDIKNVDWRWDGGSRWAARVPFEWVEPDKIYLQDTQINNEKWRDNIVRRGDWGYQNGEVFVYSEGSPQHYYGSAALQTLDNMITLRNVSNIVIRDINVQRAHDGIKIINSHNNEFINVDTHSNAQNGVWFRDNSTNNVFRDGQIYNNGYPAGEKKNLDTGSGILFSDNASNNAVVNSVSRDNIEDGATFGNSTGNGNLVQGTQFLRNGEEGVDVKAGHQRIEGNTITDNASHGISLAPGSGSAIINNNTVTIPDHSSRNALSIVGGARVQSSGNYYQGGQEYTLFIANDAGNNSTFRNDLFVGGGRVNSDDANRIDGGWNHQFDNVGFVATHPTGIGAALTISNAGTQATVQNSSFYVNGRYAVVDVPGYTYKGENNHYYRADSGSNWLRFGARNYSRSDIDNDVVGRERGVDWNSYTSPTNADAVRAEVLGGATTGSTATFNEPVQSAPEPSNPAPSNNSNGLTGGWEASVYNYNGGDMLITSDLGNRDRINLPGVNRSEANVGRSGNDLVIQTPQGTITVRDQFLETNPNDYVGTRIEDFFFRDGFVDWQALQANAGAVQSSAPASTSNGSNDAASSGGLTGGWEPDTYNYNGGDLTISQDLGNRDRLIMNGVSRDQLTFQRSGNDLTISTPSGQVTIIGQFAQTNPDVWTGTRIEDLVVGGTQYNLLELQYSTSVANTGSQAVQQSISNATQLEGGWGADVFQYNGGNLEITNDLGNRDRIVFNNLSSGDVSSSRNGNDLVFSTPSGTVTVRGQFESNGWTGTRVEDFVFRDGWRGLDWLNSNTSSGGGSASSSGGTSVSTDYASDYPVSQQSGGFEANNYYANQGQSLVITNDAGNRDAIYMQDVLSGELDVYRVGNDLILKTDDRVVAVNEHFANGGWTGTRVEDVVLQDGWRDHNWINSQVQWRGNLSDIVDQDVINAIT